MSDPGETKPVPFHHHCACPTVSPPSQWLSLLGKHFLGLPYSLPQTGWLKAAIYSLTVLEVRVSNQVVRTAELSSKALAGESFLPPPASDGTGHSLACGCLPPGSSVFAWPSLLCSPLPQISLCRALTQTLALGFRAHLDSPRSSQDS